MEMELCDQSHEALCDSGACRAVRPVSFAKHIKLAKPPPDLVLRKKLKVYGEREVPLKFMMAPSFAKIEEDGR